MPKLTARKGRSRPWRRNRATVIFFIGFATSIILFAVMIIGQIANDFKFRPAKETVAQQSLFAKTVVLDRSKCEQPNLPVESPEIMKYITQVKRITCKKTERDWVENNGTHAFVTEDAKKQHGKISCKFLELEREDDFVTSTTGKVTVGKYHKFETSDFVEVQCSVPGLNKTWGTFLAAPRANVELPFTQSQEQNLNNRNRLNVLMWGHDSLSRNMFVRKMPMTYRFLKNSLNGSIVEGYNIVGDGTPQALIPILTGNKERELPEARRSRANANFVDTYPFIWKEYREHGYLTGYMEDQPHIGTFQFRLKGFQEAPTDYYMRPYFLAVRPQQAKYEDYCTGSIPTHKVIMNYLKDIFSQNLEFPKFIFSFHSELSHNDANLIQGADADLLQFLTDLKSSNILNQTVLILMSDHGHRFAEFRETLQGKQEERKPIILFVFPKWFYKVYPTAHANFHSNKNRLSTPFDLHETLLDLLKLPNLPDAYFKEKNPSDSRGMSLFREIPKSRSCANAGIEPHWCACLHWNAINTNETLVQRVAYEFVNFLNGLTAPIRSICAHLRLGQVLWAANSYPQDELLQFKKSKDSDGLIPDLTDSTVVATTTIQIKVETLPGPGHFEVSVQYNMKSRDIKIQKTDISRINKYGPQSSCLEKDPNLEHLRKYCVCI